jgi:uncharacterized protein (TIGR03435 family)
MDLVREFARHNSEMAFALLVQRHINLVYSVALRFTGNTGDAQDVTQAVFIIFARKAAGLPVRTVFTGWLYETTRYTAIRLLRTQARRRTHEQEATMQSTLTESGTDQLWHQLAPHLEDAMSRLAERDRTLLALRFYENKTGAQAAAQLGIREDAAHKRTARALEKLRKFFTKRGVDSTTAIIARAISANSVQAAPVALAKIVTAVAIAKGATASISTLTLIKGALKIMAWTKIKTAIVVGVVVLLAAGTTMISIKEFTAHRDEMWRNRWDVTMVDKVPPQVKILPALRSRSARTEIAVVAQGGKLIGLGNDFQDLLIMAYHFSKSQMIVSTAVPEGRYDFISNLSKNQDEALQREIQKQFGVIVRREMIETNVLNLTVRSSRAGGLRHSNARSRTTFSEGPGSLICHGQMIYTFVDYLTRNLGIPVIDQTGFQDDLDIDLNWDSTSEGLKQAMRDQLGLELMSAKEPIEFLVVEKAR